MNGKCIYYVEGPCEQQLIAALKEAPAKLIAGKIKVFNVVQNIIPKSQMLSIQPGTTVVLVFDTDVPRSVNLNKNVELLKRYCGRLKIVYLAQVMNLEDELVRCSDVKAAAELTKSAGTKNFKTDFCRMSAKDCRSMLDRHHLNIARLWTTAPPDEFDSITLNGESIKIKNT